MKIAIIGAGNVGQACGKSWAAKGHAVTYGVRDPAKYAALPTAPVADAAREAEAVLLATPWGATEAAVREAGGLAGKLVLDATNPLKMDADGLGLSLGYTTSAGEMVAQWAKGAAVFKTLNTTGFGNMANAARYSARPVMFFAGDDQKHRATVASLLGDLGFEAVDAGPLKTARLLEPYAALWIDLAMKRGLGRDFAFALVRR